MVVEKIGVSSVTPSELGVALHRRGQGGRELLDEARLLSLVSESRKRGERIVMTNGCFDILHGGHVRYLEEAKSLGDRLIVAINDDSSVRALKGETRPINKWHSETNFLRSVLPLSAAIILYPNNSCSCFSLSIDLSLIHI